MKGHRHFRFAIVAGLVAAAPGAFGLTITRNFFGGTAPSNAVGAGSLQTIFNAAADCWEHHIRDQHTVALSFGWGAQSSGTLAAHSLVSQSNPLLLPGPPNRETAGSITFDNDLSSVFYMDDNTCDNSEWRTLTTSTGNFGGGTLTSGREYSGATGLAAGRFDLFSIALHEIGHALGLSFANAAFTAENGDNDIDITGPRPFAGSVFATYPGSAHLNIGSTLMYPFFGAGTRKLITDVDILANAQISRFESLDFSCCCGPANPVPEPVTSVLGGLGVAAFVRRRVKSNRKAKQAA